MIRSLIKACAVAAMMLAIAAPVAAQEVGYRTPDPDHVMVIETNKGRIMIELRPELAPAAVYHLRVLTRRGFYDGLKFFRVINRFMAQTGDPSNTGTQGSDLPDLQDEFTFRRGADTEWGRLNATEGFIGTVPINTQPDDQMIIQADGKVKSFGAFCEGVVGMAREQRANTGNAQFFIMRDDRLEMNEDYTVVGRVIEGLDVVRALKTGEPVREPMDVMERVRLLSDIPEEERPQIQIMETSGEAFEQYARRARQGLCAFEIPVVIQ